MNNVEEGIFVPSGAPKLSASLVCGNDVEFDSIQIGATGSIWAGIPLSNPAQAVRILMVTGCPMMRMVAPKTK